MNAVQAEWEPRRMWIQRKRLERDLDRWREQGWVTSAGEAAIRSELAGRGGPGLVTALSILAAVLIGFAVMSFVAANWQDMPRLARLGLLGTALVASYVAAGTFLERGMNGFGHAATLLGVAVFGASMMLISQMFHTDGNPADLVLVWALAGLVAGLGLRSNPALALSMILMTLWWWMEEVERDGVFWQFLLGWAAVAAAMYWHRWRPGIHVAGLPLAAFIVSLGYIDGPRHSIVVLAGLALAALGILGERYRPDLARLTSGTLGYATAITFAGLWALQFGEDWYVTQQKGSLANLVVLAILTLALLVAAIWWGLRTGHRGVLWLGYTGFSIEILSIYGKKFGSLLDTSLFFLVAGLLVAGLAYMAFRLHGESREVHS